MPTSPQPTPHNAGSDYGLIQCADIIATYEDSGSNQATADKAIGRWVDTGRLIKKEREPMNSPTPETPRILKTVMFLRRKKGKQRRFYRR
jgi:hypothetical protein